MDFAPKKKYYHAHQRAWINFYGSLPTGYDIHHVDGNHQNNSIENMVALTRADHMRLHKLGTKASRETRRRIAASLTGKKTSEETRGKISLVKKGKKSSEETRRKKSIALKGDKRNEEQLHRMSLGNIGKKHSDETRHKMSVSLRAAWARRKAANK